MIFTVYASSAEEVKKRLDRIGMKAAHYSVPFSYAIRKEHPQLVRVYEIDPLTETQEVIEWHTVAAVDFDIACEQLIQANGWSVRAMIEHGEQGNIVTTFGSKPADLAWFTVPAHCDHCKTNHFRKVTYFVEHESGKIQQVGRACLRDYTGIDPATAVLWAEVRDIFGDGMDCSISTWHHHFHPSEEMYFVTTVFAHAYDAIQTYGYRKSDVPDSTREEVTKRVLAQSKPSAEALETAEKINAWLIDLEQVVQTEDAARVRAWTEAEENADEFGQPAAVKCTPNTVSDLERNCIPLVRAGYAKVKHFGYLAYMPVAYERYLERKAREEKRKTERLTEAASGHVGSVGQRITFTAATARLLTSWEGAYGMTYLYKFTDEQGNVLIWYASREIDIHDDMVLKATVKNHNERDGVKQTIITRGKVL